MESYPSMSSTMQHSQLGLGQMNGVVIKTEPGFLALEPDFTPQSRARSNTWPRPRPEDPNQGPPSQEVPEEGVAELSLFPKKPTSRRNAWGSMSYADLITQAIHSAPDKRLTLSQIYDWMVGNVPYFKDKGDSNSSAGWKNSIRHNLSLHNRFMRVQNEGTGKSSWWILNPDAKPGKATRSRATSMETSKFEKKRGRVKKKLEAIRSGSLVTPSPSNSVGEGLDSFPHSPHGHLMYNLSPSDFRVRANSNASSCGGGRLSPILGENVDFGGDAGPMNSLDYPYQYNSPSFDRFGTDKLALGLANTMKLQDNSSSEFTQLQAYQAQQNFSGGVVGAPNDGFRRSNGTIPVSMRNEPISEYVNGMYGLPYVDRPSEHNLDAHGVPHEGLLVPKLEGVDQLEFNLELDANPFECNVEEVLQRELSLGEGIDFNFGSSDGGPNHHQPLTC